MPRQETGRGFTTDRLQNKSTQTVNTWYFGSFAAATEPRRLRKELGASQEKTLILKGIEMAFKLKE